MALIVFSKAAPSELVRFGLANTNFDLSPGESYETDDRGVISNARAHPWLDVQEPELDFKIPQPNDPHVSPSKDALTADNSEAFDPEAIKRDNPEPEEITPLAVDAGLKQDKVKRAGDVALTLAADPTHNDSRKSGSKE